MMSLWDALRMNMMISYQELVRTFLRSYLITEMAFNGSGVRDTARTLKIGINTVIRTLKNSRQSE